MEYISLKVHEKKSHMRILSIDFQNDFCSPDGRWFLSRPSHAFILDTLVPFLEEHDFKLAEIVSDYRLPRPNESEAYCVPGTKGFESAIPESARIQSRWIKSMNSPAWVRENGGNADKPAGVPYSAPTLLTQWMEQVFGKPQDAGEIVLVGLTLDCCVLCTAQELYFRGYKARYLLEGVDTYNGAEDEKRQMCTTPLPMWGKPISWKEVQANLESC